MADETARARKTAQGLLARREHGVQELRDKLQRKGYAESVVEPLLGELVAAGWLSDRRYCESLLRHRIAQGYGPQRVSWELGQRGVDRDLVGELLDTIAASDWRDTACRALRKRFGDGPGEASERGRRMGFLQRRGFTAAQIDQVMKFQRRGADFGADDD